MSNGPLSWDGQWEDGLRELGYSHPDDVSCDEIQRAIDDRLSEHARLTNVIRNLRKLAKKKGCPEPSN